MCLCLMAAASITKFWSSSWAFSYSQKVCGVRSGATLGRIDPFFSSRKYLFITGSTPALVAAIIEVEPVGAMAII